MIFLLSAAATFAAKSEGISCVGGACVGGGVV